MHVPVLLAFLLLGGQVLITKKGEKIEGIVAKDGATWVITTAGGERRVPEADAALVFENLREVTQRADDRFKEAKRLFEEAKALDESNPARNQKLSLAVEIAQGAAGTYQILQPHYSGASSSIPSSIQVMMQFIRICRGAATSEVATGGAGAKPGLVPLDASSFAYAAPAGEARAWELAGELGPGLGAALPDLGNPEPARRLEAVKRLVHPPSPLHLPALLRLLETERDPATLQAVEAGLAWMDPAPILKSLGWAKRETEPARRALAFSVLRSIGDRSAFDFALDWFEEAPPATHAERAAFATLFRQQHALSVPQLKELLTRSRNPKLQTEAIRQLGAIGDKAAAPMLVKTIGGYPKDSAAALSKLGKPAMPTLIEGARATDAETRRICAHWCRRFSGINQQNLTHFETWWATNRKSVLEDEKAWWDEQAKSGWHVEPGAFSIYDLSLERIVP